MKSPAYILVLFSLLFATVSLTALAQLNPPYKNPKLPIEQRVQDLLQRMTAEEKFRQLFAVNFEGAFDSSAFYSGAFGLNMNDSEVRKNLDTATDVQLEQYLLERVQYLNQIQKYFVEDTRLGIPVILIAEALHGLALPASSSFPQAIGLAASFDTTLMHEVSAAIATQVKQRGYRDILSPVINLASDVRWGRTEETYGEDPHLTSAMALAYVREIEKQNILTTPKHFVSNVGDGGRDSYPIHLDERTLNNFYLKPFRDCIREGGSRSIMSAYNAVNGRPCSMNDGLLNRKLKSEWKFRGVVISDAAAVGGANVLHNTTTDYPASGKEAIMNGLDVIFQTDIHHDTLFNPHFLQHHIPEDKIDSAVVRVLRIKFELGLFDHPYIDLHPPLFTSFDSLSKKAAMESFVLLKNNRDVLPLKNNIQRMAVIGEDAVEGRTGGYSGSGLHSVNFLEGLKHKLGDQVEINYAKGCSRNTEVFTTVPKEFCLNKKDQPGFDVDFFNGPFNEESISICHKEADEVNFYYTFYSPDSKIEKENFSVQFETRLTMPEEVDCLLGLEGNDGFRLYINDELLIDQWDKISFHRRLSPFHFRKGKSYLVRIQFYENVGNAQLKFIWNYAPKKTVEPLFQEAIDLASESDIIIFCGGINEGEYQDRSRLSLPGNQEDLLLELTQLNKPIVVVLSGGSAITMSRWIEEVDAVIDTWYGGDQQGDALASILTGDMSPSGKLPITFPEREGQLPLIYYHEPTGRGDDYLDGSGSPLFPFGYGLSYTTFEFDSLQIAANHYKEKDTVTLHFTLRNTGLYEGTEVVQMYIQQPLSRLTQPVLLLKQFDRVKLNRGEVKRIEWKFPISLLSQFDDQNKELVEKGNYRIMIGNSSRNLPLHTMIQIK